MKSRINSLQAVRALAFIGILASHSQIKLLAAGGSWGVSVFLILSGFLMIYSYFDQERITNFNLISNIKFGINKMKRLYPLHVFTFVIALPYLIYSYTKCNASDTIAELCAKIITNLLLVQSWIPKSSFYFSLNSVSWYLSVSLFLYIMFPFVYHIIKRYKSIKPAVITIVCISIVQAVLAFIAYLLQDPTITDDRFLTWFVYVFPLSRLEEFVIGCNLGYIFLKGSHVQKSKVAYTYLEIGTFVAIVVQMAIYLFNVTFAQQSDATAGLNCWWGSTVLYTISSCTLIYLFALNHGRLSKLLTNKITIFVGRVSAYAFLIHQLIYRYLESFEMKIYGGYNIYVNLVLTLFITLVCSIIWECIMKVVDGRQGLL